MDANGGDTSEDEGEDDDDNDDEDNDDMLLATQSPEPLPLLSRVYDVESPDEDISNTPCNMGDTDEHTFEPNAERLSLT